MEIFNDPLIAGFITAWALWVLGFLWLDHRDGRIMPFHQFRLAELLSRKDDQDIRRTRSDSPARYQLTFYVTLIFGFGNLALGVLGLLGLY